MKKKTSIFLFFIIAVFLILLAIFVLNLDNALNISKETATILFNSLNEETTKRFFYTNDNGKILD